MPLARVDSCKHLLHAYKYMQISLKINEINTIYAENMKKYYYLYREMPNR